MGFKEREGAYKKERVLKRAPKTSLVLFFLLKTSILSHDDDDCPVGKVLE